MRTLLSTIGSRGDVQPLVALALQLTAIGEQVRLCVPPDFQEWIAGLGLDVTPIGPELRPLTATRTPQLPALPSPEQVRQLTLGTVATQFEVVTRAAEGCDRIVAATALQIAARSVAERLGIPYTFVAFCPAVFPSPHHAPPVLPSRPGGPMPAPLSHAEQWEGDAQRFNALFRDALNEHRASAGLAPVDDVRRHIFADEPWLAADAALAPWPGSDDVAPIATGAWIVNDERPLAPELERFLEGGEPPVYFGFGSLRTPESLGEVVLAAARATGRRAIVSRGWADLAPAQASPDTLVIDEVNQQLLFPRLAAVVHHGGAGTTTAAARAGIPQVLIPQMYDQPYWAARVEALGIGVAHARGAPSVESLTGALSSALDPDVLARARALAPRVDTDGARQAALRLTGERAPNVRA